MNNLTSAQNHSTLFEELEKLKHSFSFENKEEEQKFYKKNTYLFATTSASLLRLLPQIPYSKHKSIFEKLLFNLQLLNIEEKYAEEFIPNFEVIDTEKSLDKAQNGQPFLFCCFHTGAYSLLLGLLASKSLDFGFLSNNTLTERKEKLYFEIHQRYCEKHAINSTPHFINVEDKKGIWQALRLLKQGKSLIVYADGNTGSNYSKKESQNTIRVNFLGENLQVRQGIAFLSYMCNVPIVPIISSRMDESESSLKRKFELLPAIYPPNFPISSTNFEDKNSINPTKDSISKEEFAAQTMQKLYSILEKEVSKNDNNFEKASKWEGWIFVNKFFEELHKPISLVQKTEPNLDVKKENLRYIFNEERFAVIESNKKDPENQQNQQNTLFDKFTYRFFPVSDLLYEIITYFSVPKKLYLSNEENEENNQDNKQLNNQVDKKTENSSNSPISTNFDSNSTLIDSPSKLQLSKTLISISALEKLIEKKILVYYQ